MKPDPSLRQNSTQKHLEENTTNEVVQARSELEFNSAEELLRHDRSRTSVPEQVTRRLEKSIGQTESRPVPWWRRWL